MNQVKTALLLSLTVATLAVVSILLAIATIYVSSINIGLGISAVFVSLFIFFYLLTLFIDIFFENN
ncbi:hypothetical protein JOC34_000654 [Virgibacillus halotolerans]|uniref:hypothetical protein n=1 Tax=Virgibacillus halotolerans TaxID=1071053 RepID=UPI001960A2A0|nr:hypothetical protein [Virgibacillus halotolerans]MBM7598297.1 hypothetical protein [Virgibacillus halotolerans]